MDISDEGLTAFLTLRLQPSLKEWLHVFAQKRGHNKLAFIRYILLQIKENTDNHDQKQKEILLEL